MTEAKLGPKMAALNQRQQAFVVALVENGSNLGKAYKAAGYTSANRNVQDAAASRLASTKSVQEAILEETGRRLKAHAPYALSNLIKLVENPKHKDHFAAVKHLLDVSGFTPKQKVDVSHSGTVDISWDQFKAQLEQMRQLNLPAPMIDVTPDDNSE